MRLQYFTVTLILRYALAHNENTCSAITIPMCLQMPYNTTRFPNLLQHTTQEEAAIMAHEFLPLVDIKCSPFVRFFICSVFSPMCTEVVPYGISSCKSVCISVRDSCLPILQDLNFTWPKFLQCRSFPEKGLCMIPPELKRSTQIENDVKNRDRAQFPLTKVLQKPKGVTQKESLGSVLFEEDKVKNTLCQGPRIRVRGKNNEGYCLPLCRQDFLFTSEDKNTAKIWASSWAFVSVLSTSFSLLTFCLNTKRFDYPERPVICLAFSYFFYSVPFLLRGIIDAPSLSCESDPSTGESHLAASGLSSPGCIITFLLQYYFGVASEIWWTILTFCWFMTACKFWVTEGLKNYVTYFHGIAWGLPALGVVAAIALKQVNGDELLGICYVGQVDPGGRLYFVILPQALLLLLGTIFIVIGFVSLFKIRNSFRRDFLCIQNTGSSPSTSLTTLPPSASSPSSITHSTPVVRMAVHVVKLERLMVRLGVFSVLSTLPAVFVLACRLHEHFMMEEWSKKAALGSTSCETGWNMQRCGPRQSFPPMEVELLKVFMSLIIGVTSGVWVWSRKTICLWKNFFRKTFCLTNNSRLKPGDSAVDGVNILKRDHCRVRNEPGGYSTITSSWNRQSVYSQRKGAFIQAFQASEQSQTYSKDRTNSEISTSFV